MLLASSKLYCTYEHFQCDSPLETGKNDSIAEFWKNLIAVCVCLVSHVSHVHIYYRDDFMLCLLNFNYIKN